MPRALATCGRRLKRCASNPRRLEVCGTITPPTSCCYCRTIVAPTAGTLDVCAGPGECCLAKRFRVQADWTINGFNNSLGTGNNIINATAHEEYVADASFPACNYIHSAWSGSASVSGTRSGHGPFSIGIAWPSVPIGSPFIGPPGGASARPLAFYRPWTLYFAGEAIANEAVLQATGLVGHQGLIVESPLLEPTFTPSLFTIACTGSDPAFVLNGPLYRRSWSNTQACGSTTVGVTVQQRQNFGTGVIGECTISATFSVEVLIPCEIQPRPGDGRVEAFMASSPLMKSGCCG